MKITMVFIDLPASFHPFPAHTFSCFVVKNRKQGGKESVSCNDCVIRGKRGRGGKGKKEKKGEKEKTAVKGRCNHRTSIPKQILTRNDEDGFSRVRDRVYTEREIEKFVEKLYEVMLCRVYSVEELSNVITSKIIIESAVVS